MKNKEKKILLWILDIAVNIAVIIVLVVVIQKWIIAPFDVSGSSMCNTLNLIEEKCTNGKGEKIIINEAKYLLKEPTRGEIVVFESPFANEEKYFIKRIIGIPGDKVEIKNGNVFVNGIHLDEDYLNEKNKGHTEIYLSGFDKFEVPEGHYFMLGDNRLASTDSRSCFRSTISLDCKDHPQEAYVARENIRGQASVVWWPLKNMRLIYQKDYPELSESLEEK